MGIRDLPAEGTWFVDSNDIAPDAVYMAFTEPDEAQEGLRTYGFYMPPEEALKFGEAVMAKAKDML